MHDPRRIAAPDQAPAFRTSRKRFAATQTFNSVRNMTPFGHAWKSSRRRSMGATRSRFQTTLATRGGVSRAASSAGVAGYRPEIDSSSSARKPGSVFGQRLKPSLVCLSGQLGPSSSEWTATRPARPTPRGYWPTMISPVRKSGEKREYEVAHPNCFLAVLRGARQPKERASRIALT